MTRMKTMRTSREVVVRNDDGNESVLLFDHQDRFNVNEEQFLVLKCLVLTILSQNESLNVHSLSNFSWPSFIRLLERSIFRRAHPRCECSHLPTYRTEVPSRWTFVLTCQAASVPMGVFSAIMLSIRSWRPHAVLISRILGVELRAPQNQRAAKRSGWHNDDALVTAVIALVPHYHGLSTLVYCQQVWWLDPSSTVEPESSKDWHERMAANRINISLASCHCSRSFASSNARKQESM